MFLITAKLDKRKIIGGALVLVVLAAAAILLLGGGGGDAEPTANLSASVKTNSQRVSWLRSLGWEVSEDAIDQQTVTIPKDFSKTYADYNELQLSQGFDLRKFSGFEAVRYTYEIKNHPNTSDPVVADMIVYRGKVIAADVQSLSAKDGFMEGIQFPS